MQKLCIYLAILACSLLSKAYAQETFESKAREIAYQIEKITKEEKSLLKENVELVNNDLEKGIINRSQADEKKLQLAEETAAKIESRVAEEEAKLTLLVKDKVEGRIKMVDTSKTYGKRFAVSVGERYRNKLDTLPRSEKRTTSQFVFAAGVNNLVTNKAVAHSDFRYWGSHFYELGLTYNTRIFKNDNLLHFKYGLSVQYNNLRPTDNRYFVENKDQTDLQTAGINLKDSRLRNVNLVMPLYLEFDFSGNDSQNSTPFFRTHKSFRFGLGGFAGINVKTKQIVKYNDEIGHSVTQKTKGDFNTNDFVYGLGAYIGWEETSLYLKYDLNPLFKNNSIDQNNISLGLRFDLN